MMKGTGSVRMVDITRKPISHRQACARAVVAASKELVAKIRTKKLPKGDCLAAAEIAAIQAAKNTASLIPLCHQINLTGVDVVFELLEDRIVITSTVTARYATGVEMEAMTASCVAALTIYDMLKSQKRDVEIVSVKLLKKTGGRRGDYFLNDK
jgi:cyclic pyranopterin phosphate synthase